MVKIPYEGPRFSSPDYRGKCRQLEQRVAELERRERAIMDTLEHPDIVKGYVELKEKYDKLRELLGRYRNEVPLGHQPHMIAHEVDTALEGEQDGS